MSNLSLPPSNAGRVALAHAVHFFAPELAQTFVDFASEVDVPQHVGRFLAESVGEFLPFRQAQGLGPGPVQLTSVEHFLKMISSTFSPYYINGFRNNCKYFDHLVGPGSLVSVQGQALKPSDILIRELGLKALIADICQAIAYHAWDIAFCPPKPCLSRPIPQFDGADDPSSDPPQAGVTDDGGPFK
ncbi:hypothetical protein TOPH_06043 [Tolypocladium ophioglossoides CBS 100239]|uniref:Uncharacterized protein n=1 Tax=Tolypocladium ophioglossoides (strain CBS 100239) TaxID=1163406 RepID=A0A0L0N5L6_TOLOC|nr:hypothetical protein TOPH_06043 [Tolypocladium ophioglossoides CBS 100239]